MSCTCKTSPFCEPCAFCTPPGVTDLKLCVPVDPCPEKINLDCVLYSGDAHTCSSITHLESLTSIILKIFGTIYPNAYCCFVKGTLVLDSGNVYILKITGSGPDPGPFNIFYVDASNNVTSGATNVAKSEFTKLTGYSITLPVGTVTVRLQSVNSGCPPNNFTKP